MIRKTVLSLSAALLLILTGCIKETYNMDTLSKSAHISPTLAITAVKGVVAFSDIVESGDTVVFGNDNFVTLVFRNDSVIDMRPSDFTQIKGPLTFNNGLEGLAKSGSNPLPGPVNASLGQWEAAIKPDTIDLGIQDILSHFSGDILISDPRITLSYTNSFADPIQVDFRAQGRRDAATTDLNLAPFSLEHPADTLKPPVAASYLIDKNNSLIQTIVSMPPDIIAFSGSAKMNVSSENRHNDFLAGRRFTGSVLVEVPLQLRIHNLQYTDTTDNFLADAFKDNKNMKWSDFKLFRVDFDVKNGFPFGISIQMNLLDSISHAVISTAGPTEILSPATIDEGGRSVTEKESKTSLTFTKEFFESISKSDKIEIRFTMNTTGEGSGDVKIYSDYKLDFKASLVLQPDIKFDF